MAEKYAYIARCRKCNGIVMTTIDDPKYKGDVAKIIAEHINDGYFIERVTVSSARKLIESNCVCEICKSDGT